MNFYKHSLKKRNYYKTYFLSGFLGLFLGFIFFIYNFLSPFQDFLKYTPELLGFFGQKNYLAILQNNSEIRPGGGFITAYAEISFFLGIPKISFHNSYDISPPQSQITPPYPLKKLLKEGDFYKGYEFRDVNWSPDYPTNVKNILKFYHLDPKKTKKINGLITVNMNFFRELVNLYPIKIEDTIIKKTNLFHFFQINSKNIDLHNKEDLKERKSIMKPFFYELVKEIIFSPEKYKSFKNLVLTALNKRIIFLNHQTNPKIQTLIINKKWDASFKLQSDNFIHISKANIGGRKADRYLISNYQYNILLDKDNLKNNLLINLTHSGTQGLYSDFYQAYIKIYLPLEAKLNNLSGDNREEFKKEVFEKYQTIGTLVHIWPGETQKLVIDFSLPKDFFKNLNIIPQLGNWGENWQIIVREPNTDTHFKSSDYQCLENVCHYQNKIFTPKILKTKQLKDKTPPLIIWQKFLDTKTIELLFSEKLAEKTLNKNNFKIKDLNKNVKNIEDKPQITQVFKAEKYKIHLKVNDLNWQVGEHFSLELKNIKDLAGNLIKPHPKTITLVMR
jgi:hypothetical protein